MMKKMKRAGQIRRASLAALLGAAPFAANATVISESAALDFGDTEGTATILDSGVFEVSGSVLGEGGGDPYDYFQFTGLLPATSYTLTFDAINYSAKAIVDSVADSSPECITVYAASAAL